MKLWAGQTKASGVGGREPKAFRLRTAGVSALVVLGATSGVNVARAQGLDAPVIEVQREGHFNVQRFRPAPGPRNFLTTRTVRSDGQNAFSVSALANFAYEPLVVQLASDVCQGRQDCSTRAVQGLATLDLMPTFTPIPQLQIGLRIPLVYAYGQGMTADGLPQKDREKGVEGIDTFALSDPELEVKGRFYGTMDSPIALGAAAFATAPIGRMMAEDAFIGSESLTAGGRLIVDGKAGMLTYAVNAGYRYQGNAKIVSNLGSEGFASAALGATLAPTVRVLADIVATSQFESVAGTTTAELGVAGQYTPLMSQWTVTIGGGPGLVQGAIGVPVVRGFVGVSYTHERRDEDLDGIMEPTDLCPASAEDVDGFEDADGCPDMDNDGDVIADGADKCPDQAEDADNFEDLDGCPEQDNDKDGITDDQDRCPLEAEALNGFDDEDGCPDVKDSDRDGLADDKDKCPTEAEDTDGFDDTDGCPDLDNDGDTIPDDRDECGDKPEDMNGVNDEDGCPEEVMDLD